MRVSFRLEKKKSNQLKAIAAHNQRLNPDSESKILNSSETANNACLYRKHHLDIDASIALEISHLDGKKPRKDAVVALEMILSASPEYFRPDDPAAVGTYDKDRLKAWTDKNLEAIKNKFGNRLVQVDLHLDESTPHMHIIVIPTIEKEMSRRRTKAQIEAGKKAETYTAKRLDAKSLTKKGGEYDYSHLQDYFAEAVEPLDIKRGIKGSRAAHSKLKDLNRAIAEAFDGAPDSPKIPKNPKRKSVVKGFFRKQSQEDDASYFKRAFEMLKKWADKKLGDAYAKIAELTEALALVNKQLDQERERTRLYSQVNGEPERLVEIKKDLMDREHSLVQKEKTMKLASEQLLEEGEKQYRLEVQGEMKEKDSVISKQADQIKELEHIKQLQSEHIAKLRRDDDRELSR